LQNRVLLSTPEVRENARLLHTADGVEQPRPQVSNNPLQIRGTANPCTIYGPANPALSRGAGADNPYEAPPVAAAHPAGQHHDPLMVLPVVKVRHHGPCS
jgi:hypothetical protein